MIFFLFFFFSDKKLNLPFLIGLNFLPATIMPLYDYNAWSYSACQNGNMREMSMRTTVLFFFFFNSQFPCNSHHKVKQIYATEYVVAVMAESMVFLDCISSSHSWA